MGFFLRESCVFQKSLVKLFMKIASHSIPKTTVKLRNLSVRIIMLYGSPLTFKFLLVHSFSPLLKADSFLIYRIPFLLPLVFPVPPCLPTH